MSNEVFKILAIILIGAILIIILKTNRPDISFILSLSVSAVALFLIIKAFYSPAKSLVSIYKSSIGNNSTIGVVIKAIAISYMAEFCGDTCRDYGLTALAQKAELAGKCAILVLSIPLVSSILKSALELSKL